MMIHYNDESKLESALEYLKSAYRLAPQAAESTAARGRTGRVRRRVAHLFVKLATEEPTRS